MNLGENRIGKRILRLARSPAFRIPKPFLIEFITASREVFNALRWIVRAGASWRMLPHDFPPWEAVYQQTRRWIAAGVFEAIVHDLRALLRLGEGRDKEPTAAILDSRTLRSSPESGHRSGYDGAKRKKGSKVHAAVDTLGFCCSGVGT